MDRDTENWERPQIEHNRDTRWGWRVAHPENLHLGDEVDIGYGCYLQAQHGMIIGAGTQLGGHCRLYTANTIAGSAGPIVIGECVRICANVTILPNVTIEDGATIIGGSVVPDGSVVRAGTTWAGNPAKPVGAKVWAVTGGTGSIGRAIVEELLKRDDIDAIRVISRDEAKHAQMQAEVNDARVRYVIADITNGVAMLRALRGVHTVVHAAAMKRVETSEYNATTVVQTNVTGTENVADACMGCMVRRMLLISTDKAANPVNVMGQSKALAESLLLRHYAFIGGSATKFWVVRLGNILGSRGSLVPAFNDAVRRGVSFNLTDPEMTRFFLGKNESTKWILSVFDKEPGLHIPRCRAMKVGDVVDVLNGECGIDINVVGAREGEKMHEELMTKAEADFRGWSDNDYRSDCAPLLSKGAVREWLIAEALLGDGCKHG